MSIKIVSNSDSLSFVILVGKFTTWVRFKVFIKVSNFDASLPFVRRFMFRSPQIRKVNFGCKRWVNICSISDRKYSKFPVGALYMQKIISFCDSN